MTEFEKEKRETIKKCEKMIEAINGNMESRKHRFKIVMETLEDDRIDIEEETTIDLSSELNSWSDDTNGAEMELISALNTIKYLCERHIEFGR